MSHRFTEGMAQWEDNRDVFLLLLLDSPTYQDLVEDLDNEISEAPLPEEDGSPLPKPAGLSPEEPTTSTALSRYGGRQEYECPPSGDGQTTAIMDPVHDVRIITRTNSPSPFEGRVVFS